jgi:hypothetical protein
MSTTVRFNEFHIGESVRNRETNENGKIVGFRDTAEIPQYQVIVPGKVGLTLILWPETVLETSA